MIGRRADRTIVVDPGVSERITLKTVDVSWGEAVDTVARLAKCEVVERDGGVLLQPVR